MGFGDRWTSFKEKNWREIFIGDPERYDYKSMCTVQAPCVKQENKKQLVFYGK